MKAIVPVHTYEVENMDGGCQTIQFIRKENKDGKLVTVDNGTTNEELLAVLIDRIMSLNQKMPSDYNYRAIAHLMSAKEALEDRTKERKERGVEGTPNP